MAKHFKYLLLCTLLSTSLLAKSNAFSLERLEITLSQNKNGNTVPSLFMPIYWNKHLFSGLGYDSFTLASSVNEKEGNIIAEGLSASSQSIYNFNVLQYQQQKKHIQYSFGLALKYSDVKNQEFANLTNKTDTSFMLNLKNETYIKSFSTGLSADFALKKLADFFSLRVGAYFYPYSTLDVTHKLNEFTTSSDDAQDMTYKFFLITYFETNLGLNFSLNAKYSKEAYNYDINTLDLDGSTSSLKTSFTKLRGEAKVLYSNKSMSIYPMLGLAYENITSDYGSGTQNELNTLVLFGLEKPF